MSKPILDTNFWKERIRDVNASGDPLHYAVYKVDEYRMECINAQHRKILGQHIQPHDRVLDAGCGYGRLLKLLPGSWRGKYLGIDFSPDFIEIARAMNPERAEQFWRDDLRNIESVFDCEFDWAVCISIRAMIVNNCGGDVWSDMLNELKRCAKRVLILEYDEADPGDIL